MTGLDTNVLVRFLVEDDRRQTDRVHRFLARSRTLGERVYISAVVLCETVWVLRSGYAKSRAEILEAVQQLLSTDIFLVEEEDSVRAALLLCRTGKADFADCLIGQIHLARACRSTVTFDRSLSATPGFTIL
ncbi:MAG: type II toxin-antitoxin system VapC family toxin [Acidobacteria bacterium]|nr:type II toxin-antitoxin system VapC family toxin [Acidobacteriota bacterium]